MLVVEREARSCSRLAEDLVTLLALSRTAASRLNDQKAVEVSATVLSMLKVRSFVGNMLKNFSVGLHLADVYSPSSIHLRLFQCNGVSDVQLLDKGDEEINNNWFLK